MLPKRLYDGFGLGMQGTGNGREQHFVLFVANTEPAVADFCMLQRLVVNEVEVHTMTAQTVAELPKAVEPCVGIGLERLGGIEYGHVAHMVAL